MNPWWEHASCFPICVVRYWVMCPPKAQWALLLHIPIHNCEHRRSVQWDFTANQGETVDNKVKWDMEGGDGMVIGIIVFTDILVWGHILAVIPVSLTKYGCVSLELKAPDGTIHPTGHSSWALSSTTSLFKKSQPIHLWCHEDTALLNSESSSHCLSPLTLGRVVWDWRLSKLTVGKRKCTIQRRLPVHHSPKHPKETHTNSTQKGPGPGGLGVPCNTNIDYTICKWKKRQWTLCRESYKCLTILLHQTGKRDQKPKKNWFHWWLCNIFLTTQNLWHCSHLQMSLIPTVSVLFKACEICICMYH